MFRMTQKVMWQKTLGDILAQCSFNPIDDRYYLTVSQGENKVISNWIREGISPMTDMDVIDQQICVNKANDLIQELFSVDITFP